MNAHDVIRFDLPTIIIIIKFSFSQNFFYHRWLSSDCKMVLRRIDMRALFLDEQWNVKCKEKIRTEFTICFNRHLLVFFSSSWCVIVYVRVRMCVWQRLIVRVSHLLFLFPTSPHPISICNMKYHALTSCFVLKFNVSILCEVDRQIDSLEMAFRKRITYFHNDKCWEFV